MRVYRDKLFQLISLKILMILNRYNAIIYLSRYKKNLRNLFETSQILWEPL